MNSKAPGQAADLSMTIRPAHPGDASILAEFNAAIAAETEGLALDRQTLERGVRGVFDDPSRGRYFVAEVQGRVVGQLMITYEWSDWRNGNIWWIQSVYVHPAHRRGGIFRALYEHVEALALREGAAAIRLYVEQDNTVAQRTYARLGMKMTHYRVMEKSRR